MERTKHNFADAIMAIAFWIAIVAIFYILFGIPTRNICPQCQYKNNNKYHDNKHNNNQYCSLDN